MSGKDSLEEGMASLLHYFLPGISYFGNAKCQMTVESGGVLHWVPNSPTGVSTQRVVKNKILLGMSFLRSNPIETVVLELIK